MTSFSPTAIAVGVFLLASLTRGQCATVPTTLAGGSGQKGTTFDVVNVGATPLTISGFEQAFLMPGTANFEIYTRAGGWQGFETTPAAWTLAGSTMGLTHPGAGNSHIVPLPLQITVAPGARQGFYLTCTNATASAVSYTAGIFQLDAVVAADAMLEVRAGVGLAYPFNSPFGLPSDGRIWNGSLRYHLSSLPSWETNDPLSSVDAGGAQASPCRPATLDLCQGAIVSMTLATTAPGSLFEAALSLGPALPFGAGGVATAGGQILNLDFTNQVYYANGFLLPMLVPHPGQLPLVFPMPGGLTFAVQQLVATPTLSDGFSLSQALELRGNAAATIPGPTMDDEAVVVDFSGPPLCGPGAAPIYGTTYTRGFVISNGHVQFGTATPDLGAFPALVFAASGNARIGNWCDLDPTAGGSIQISTTTAGLLRVQYTAVPYFNSLTTNTFELRFDLGTGQIEFDNLSGIGPGGPQLAFLGLSPGTGASDPGPANFAPASAGVTLSPTAMLYAFGTSGAVAPGVNRITFLPNAVANYDFFCQ